jgi:hypothetical protein
MAGPAIIKTTIRKIVGSCPAIKELLKTSGDNRNKPTIRAIYPGKSNTQKSSLVKKEGIYDIRVYF